jgi:hypothetical protein
MDWISFIKPEILNKFQRISVKLRILSNETFNLNSKNQKLRWRKVTKKIKTVEYKKVRIIYWKLRGLFSLWWMR